MKALQNWRIYSPVVRRNGGGNCNIYRTEALASISVIETKAPHRQRGKFDPAQQQQIFSISFLPTFTLLKSLSTTNRHRSDYRQHLSSLPVPQSSLPHHRLISRNELAARPLA